MTLNLTLLIIFSSHIIDLAQYLLAKRKADPTANAPSRPPLLSPSEKKSPPDARSRQVPAHHWGRDSSGWDKPQSGTRQRRLVLVVSEVRAGGYGTGRLRGRGTGSKERPVGRSAAGAAVGVAEGKPTVLGGRICTLAKIF